MNKEWSRIVSLVSVATFVCAGILNAQVSSSKLRNYNAERNLLALNANAPAGTKSVRFTIDNMQVAELTDEYGIKTNTKPVWKTVIDPAWLDKGERPACRTQPAKTTSAIIYRYEEGILPTLCK